MLQALKSARTGTSYWARSAIYADRSIIVLNKPAGLICQGSEASSENVGELIVGMQTRLLPSVTFVQKPECNKFDDLLRGASYLLVIDVHDTMYWFA
jgi:hypothetical protein